jgi:hypothetical protein
MVESSNRLIHIGFELLGQLWAVNPVKLRVSVIRLLSRSMMNEAFRSTILPDFPQIFESRIVPLFEVSPDYLQMSDEDPIRFVVDCPLKVHFHDLE